MFFHPKIEQDNIEAIIENSKINLREINGEKKLGIQGSTKYLITWTWIIFNSIRADKTIEYSTICKVNFEWLSKWFNWHVTGDIKHSKYSHIIMNQGVQAFDIYKNHIKS